MYSGMSFRDRDDRNYNYGGYNWNDEEQISLMSSLEGTIYRDLGSSSISTTKQLNGWNTPFPWDRQHDPFQNRCRKQSIRNCLQRNQSKYWNAITNRWRHPKLLRLKHISTHEKNISCTSYSANTCHGLWRKARALQKEKNQSTANSRSTSL